MCYFFLALTLSNCEVPYDPPLKSTDVNSLVVEGFIDGAAPVIFKIGRTRALTVGDTATRNYELNAIVSIEDDHQNRYPLIESGGGIYSSSGILNLNSTSQYRLHIFTADHREYLSDLVPFKQSPPIDTVSWKIKDEGVQISLNTRDVNNATRYYRWEYSETWEFHSRYSSSLEAIITRNPDYVSMVPRLENVFTCWQTHNSTNILLGSSAKLTNDVINEMPINYVEPHDKKISVKYSIWVKQYALDIKGYNYLEAIRNNTENVGSIFDPQPNQTGGNIHCITDPAEKVIGYVNAGNSVEKRIFIKNSELPTSWNIFPDCPTYDVPNIQDSLLEYFDGGWEPLFIKHLSSGQIVYSASYKECVNCTLSGTNIKPSFWH